MRKLAKFMIAAVLVAGCGSSATVVPNVNGNTEDSDSGSPSTDSGMPVNDSDLNGDSGTCSDSACLGGQVCENGVCVVPNPCEGVCCPKGEVCKEGACIIPDPCEGVTCCAGQACKAGVCVSTDPCADVHCCEGDVCKNGLCVPIDPCAGVTCPEGKECKGGACVCDGETPPPPEAGCSDSCGEGKTLICHYPPGDPDNDHNICVGNPAVPAHLGHGDKLGVCPQ